MADYATKSDIKEIKGLISEQTDIILNAVDEKLGAFKTEVNERFDKVEEAIKELTLTLDEFMKRVMRQDEEIAVLNAKVDKITSFLKQKFGVEISAQ